VQGAVNLLINESLDEVLSRLGCRAERLGTLHLLQGGRYYNANWRTPWIRHHVAEVPMGCFFDDDLPEPVQQVNLG
jgi:hypothetical protein